MGTPHIAASYGEISERIILTKDSLHSRFISENFLREPVLFNEIRGMSGYTGYYKGTCVSVLASGVGVPSVSIYTNELLEQYGVKKLIHTGNCTSLSQKVKNGDIILAMGCCTDNAFTDNVFPGDFAPIADYFMLESTYESLNKRDIKPHVGLLHTTDMPYAAPSVERNTFGILGLDTEGAAIYTLASKFGAKALVMSFVTGQIEDFLTGDSLKLRGLETFFETALDTVTAC